MATNISYSAAGRGEGALVPSIAGQAQGTALGASTYGGATVSAKGKGHMHIKVTAPGFKKVYSLKLDPVIARTVSIGFALNDSNATSETITSDTEDLLQASVAVNTTAMTGQIKIEASCSGVLEGYSSARINEGTDSSECIVIAQYGGYGLLESVITYQISQS